MQAGNSRVRRNLKIATAALIGTALTPLSALAQDATWGGGGGSSYSIATNWTPAVVPTNRATFENAGASIVDLDSMASINQFLFTLNAQGYSFFNSDAFLVKGIDGVGVDNRSGHVQTITNNSVLGFTNASIVGDAGVALSNNATITGNASLFLEGATQLDSNVTLTNVGGDAATFGGTNAGFDATTYFDQTAGADGATIGLSAGNGSAHGTGGIANATGGDATMNFDGSSHADNTVFSVSGGFASANATTDGATASGGQATLAFNDSSHADGATFALSDGYALASVSAFGKTVTANGGVGRIVFFDTSHADNATFDITGTSAFATGGNGALGTPFGTGQAGGDAYALGGAANLEFGGNSHADGAAITIATLGANGIGGTGGGGGVSTPGGAGGSVGVVGSTVTLDISDNAHLNNATVDTTIADAQSIGGFGGDGGTSGSGGAGGYAVVIGDAVNISIADNANVAGTIFTNTAGAAVAQGGFGGDGAGVPLGSGGGDGGQANVTGGSVTLTVADDVVLGTGTEIHNTAGAASASGGPGGDGLATLGGDGGQGIATGGNAIVTFTDDASAGNALIVNTGGTASATGGTGGDGGAGGASATGGDGGAAYAIAGLAAVIFTDSSTAGSATIENHAGAAVIAMGGTAGVDADPSVGGAGGAAGTAVATSTVPEILFADSSTGGSAHLTNDGGAVVIADNAVFGSAVGGGARIDNGNNGNVLFQDSGSLGNALLVNGDVATINAVTFTDMATAGTGAITNNGFGFVTFTGSSTLGSATVTNAGSVNFTGSSDAVAGSVVNKVGGSVNVLVDGFRLGSLSGDAGSGVAINSTSLQVGYLDRDETFSGTITGVGQLVKRGTGTFTLSGTNSYAGGTTIADGTVQLDNLAGAGTGAITLADGNLRTTVSGALGNIVGWGAGSDGVLSAATGTTLMLTGTIFSSASAGNPTNLRFGTAGDTGTIELDESTGVLSGVQNTSLTVQGGTLRAGNGILAFLTGNVGTTTIDAGATLDFNGQSGNVLNLQGAGTLTNSVDTLVQAGDFAGSITGTGSLTKITDATLTLTGTNTYSGTTTISAGTLQIGNGGTSGTLGTGDVVDNASLVFDRSDSFTVGNAISGSGTLTQHGTGKLILTGANAYTGTTFIDAGSTLQAGNGGTTGGIASASIVDNGALIADRSDDVTYGGVISGSGSLTKTGGGVLRLTGNNTYTGGTTVSLGALVIGNNGTTGSVVGDIVDNSAVVFFRSDTLTYGGNITGTGAFGKSGAGTLILTGSISQLGLVQVSQGTLQIGNGGTTGVVSTDIVDNAALAFDRSDAITYGGVVSGTGSLSQIGGGTLTLTGANTYTGGTTISAGTLRIGDGGTTGSIAGNVLDNASLIFDRSDTIAFSGVVSGTGSLTKAGAGTLVLGGANTYTGPTTVSAGTLRLAGSVASNTTVNAGTTLDGTGTINGALIVNGRVAPGTPAAPFGTLTVTGNAAFNAGSTLQPTVAADGSSSRLAAGSLTLGGGSVVPVTSGNGFFLMSTDYLIASGGVTGTFAGIDESFLPTYLDGTLLYSNAGVTLRLRRNVTTFGTTAGLTPNQAAVGGSLDASVAAGNPLVFSTYADLYNTLLIGGQTNVLRGQLETLSGGALTPYSLVEERNAQRFGDRLEQYTWSNSSNLWGLVAYGDQQADSDGNGPGFRAKGTEFQLGFATSLAENTRLGISAGYSNMDVGSSGLNGGVDTWSVGLHLRGDFGGLYAAGQGTYNWHSADSRRTLLAGTATASFDARTWTLGGEVGGVIPVGVFSFEPFASVRHAETSQDAFSEVGSAGALDVAAEDFQTTRYGVGLRIANRDPAMSVHFTGQLRYERQSGDDVAALDNAIQGLAGFRALGTDLGDDIFSAQAGVEFHVTQAVTLFGAARGSWRKNESDAEVNGGLRIRF
jgi:autotransporter-associated beta strand protein